MVMKYQSVLTFISLFSVIIKTDSFYCLNGRGYPPWLKRKGSSIDKNLINNDIVKSSSTRSTDRIYSSSDTAITSVLKVIDDEETVKKGIKQWYFMQERVRPEVFIADCNSVTDVIKELWRQVLIGQRLFEAEKETQYYVSVTAIRNLKLDSKSLGEFENVVADIASSFSISPRVFSPDVARRIEVLNYNRTNGEDINEDILCISLKMQKVKTSDITFDDITLDTSTDPDYIPPELNRANSDIWNNNIESFPFLSVFDFISEINRPPDPETMANLRFNFKIQDFKYDLEKMSKKKNPQEVVNGINCRNSHVVLSIVSV